MRLTNKTLEDITPKARVCFYKDHIVPDLTFQVCPDGTRNWILRLSIATEDTQLLVGPYPELDLSKARSKARLMLKERGIAPDHELLHVPSLKRSNFATALKSLRNGHVSNQKNQPKTEFRPHPLFKKPQKTFNSAQDFRQSKTKFRENDAQISAIAHMNAAWDKFQASGNIDALTDFLDSEDAARVPMRADFAQVISKRLNAGNQGACNEEAKADARLFMMYWRQTDFLNCEKQVLLDETAVRLCQDKLAEMGITMSIDQIASKITKNYAQWRKDNTKKLVQSQSFLKKVLREIERDDA